ncbi:MAG: class I SAM-dependent methyltransferase [Anaerolineales bacterium]|nr:MAG: class I SAM-dependent methyltransferase [Anaerolineales bacterium]
MARDYLTEALDAYWFAPPVALWRAVELRIAAQEMFEGPLLDLGCGDGLVARVLFGPEAQVDAGLDLSEVQLGRARATGAYGHVALGAADRLPYVGESFATVFSNSVLEHIRDVTPVVREVSRLLMPDGQFIFTVPSEMFRLFLRGYSRRRDAGDVSGAEKYAAAVDARLQHYHYYNPSDWRHLLATVRLNVVNTRYYIPQEVEQLWDRMNTLFGVGRRLSPWGVLVSPRLRSLRYQDFLRRLVVRTLSGRWRRYYEMDVPAGEKGGGLLVVARLEQRWY